MPLHAKQTQRGGGDVARRGWVVSATVRRLYHLKKRPWVGPGTGLYGSEKFLPTGVPTPDGPARSESLY
jgi:hypothetical protein